MMETFLVLGLCFILYEALDFFQGCINSSQPSTTDQIEAFRRQLEEQRQQQQQEQFLANLTPLLAAQFAAHNLGGSSSTPTASTASVISDLRAQHQLAIQQRQQELLESHSVSTPALNGGLVGRGALSGNASANGGLAANGSAFRPAHRSAYEVSDLYTTSSLPRDYYYVQKQQLKNKNSSRSLLSKLSTSSGGDNRIFPESPSVLGVPPGVITTQPLGLASTSFLGSDSNCGSSSNSASTFDCQPPPTPPVVGNSSTLALDLKRAILSNNDISNSNETALTIQARSIPRHLQQHLAGLTRLGANPVIATTIALSDSENEGENSYVNVRPKRRGTKNTKHRNLDDREEDDGDDDDDEDEESSGASSCGESTTSVSPSAGSASLASCAYTSDQTEGGEEECTRSVDFNRSEHFPHNLLQQQTAVGSFASTSFISSSPHHTPADFREIECERLRRKCVSVKRIYSISEKF